MVEVGKRYYFIEHVYHHLCGEVVAIETPKKYRLKNVVRVQGCARGWTQFWRDGFGTDTQYTVWPDGTVVNDPMIEVPWHHDIPRG